jgi:hypothetical protein
MSIHRDDIVAVGADLDPRRSSTPTGTASFRGRPRVYRSSGSVRANAPILDFDRLHVGRSAACARRSELRFTIDAAFPEVIRGCAAMPRVGQARRGSRPTFRLPTPASIASASPQRRGMAR